MYAHTLSRQWIGSALVVLVTAACSAASSNVPLTVQQTVDEILLQIGTYEMTATGAETRLDEFPDQDVITALLTTLNRTPTLKEDGRRAFAYRVLRDRGAVNTEMGFRQFLVGLHDPAGTAICVEVLLDAPEERQPEAQAHIKGYLQTAKQSESPRHTLKGPYVDRVLRAIARRGSDANAFVDVVEGVLRDPLQHNDVRAEAAWAILQMKRLGEAWDHFENLDPVGLGASVKALGGRIAQLLTEADKARRPYAEVYDEHRHAIKGARALVLNALQSHRPETQAAALEPMTVVYGNDILVVRSEDDYELNPDLRPLLIRIAQDHPDEGVRQRVASLLDPAIQRRMAQRVLEIRHREGSFEQKDE